MNTEETPERERNEADKGIIDESQKRPERPLFEAETHKETDAEQMDRRHKFIAQRAQKKAIEALAQIAPEDMTATEARQLLKTAQDIERKSTQKTRDPEKQREEVQALFERVWEAAKGG